MESRVKEYLETCGINQSNEEFIDEVKDLIKQNIMNDEFKKELKKHIALANENRLLIYKLIQKYRLCNCTIAAILGISEGSVTHHIKKLENAGLIVGRKRGHFTVYYTAEDLITELK